MINRLWLPILRVACVIVASQMVVLFILGMIYMRLLSNALDPKDVQHMQDEFVSKNGGSDCIGNSMYLGSCPESFFLSMEIAQFAWAKGARPDISNKIMTIELFVVWAAAVIFIAAYYEQSRCKTPIV